MNKTFKKIISLVLALIMLMSVCVAAFSVSAEDATELEGEEVHRNFYEIIWDFCVEIYNFFKYIFYDMYLGKAP